MEDDALWMPQSAPQWMAALSQADEVYYGGAAGGGKSDLLLGLAITAHQHSIIFRRELTQLSGPAGLVECTSDPDSCERSGSCTAHRVWCELREVMDRFLSSKTLRDLVEQENDRNVFISEEPSGTEERKK